MEAFGGKGFFVEDPRDLRDALDGDELPRLRPRQRRYLAGLRPQAAAVPVAQLIE
jgi:hypothetical protein